MAAPPLLLGLDALVANIDSIAAPKNVPRGCKIVGISIWEEICARVGIVKRGQGTADRSRNRKRSHAYLVDLAGIRRDSWSPAYRDGCGGREDKCEHDWEPAFHVHTVF